ncbi:hypothetical protein SAMN04489844_1784 [Nocardioides exalbidus]|uniref:Uncharacterized protein n=1 Tax=Nocardioides exalbidus TaxID=402596 RepID=A0A1H4Q792_9ACTN|nr:hypothetical protein [Nocardioides exalbidus]SEC15506.1 hypothetical protein SAMN04489844_1784 [Nocardioides exalbidus]
MADDDLPHRGGKPLPDGFGPLEPIWGTGGPAPTRDPDAPRPRSRLTSSALRRNAPDVAVTVAPAPARPVAGDAAPVPEVATPVRPGPRRRTAVVGAVLGALLVGSAATALLWPDGQEGGSAVAVESAARPPAPTSELAPPVALAPDNEHVETDVLADGSLQVTHWISTTEPVRQVALRVPRSPGLEDAALAVDDVVVGSDGVRLDVDVAPGAPARAIDPTRTLYVRYVLPGAVDLTGSATGRGLATVTALDVGLGGATLARTQVFASDDVLTLACLGRGARAVPELCGTRVGDTWEVISPADDRPVTVIAQLDLTPGR